MGITEVLPPMPFHDRVARVMVTFNSASVLAYSYLAPHEVETLVVDNASDDDSVSQALAFGYRVVQASANLGYGIATMQGIERLKHEYVLIANPDLTITFEAIADLVEAADQTPNADIFVPQILRPNGEPFFRETSRLMPDLNLTAIPTTQTAIPLLSGAVMLVRRQAFLQDGFDPKIFLYFEDDELSLRYQKAGKPLMFIPHVEATHLGGKSSPSTPAIERLKALSYGWGWGYGVRKHNLGHIFIIKWRIRLKQLGALGTLRFARARRQAMILKGFKRAIRGEPAPYLPDMTQISLVEKIPSKIE